MRRLVCYFAGSVLMLAVLGCPSTAPAGQPGTSGQPATQTTTADPPTEDISADPAAENSGEPMKLSGSRGDQLEDRTGRAKAEVPGGDLGEKPGPTPSIEEVEAHLRRVIYPGSVFSSEQEITNNGRVAMAMTKAPASMSTVRDHYAKLGATTIDQRTEGAVTNITMELIDRPRGVKMGIQISDALAAGSECTVNYSAHGIPIGKAEEKPKQGPSLPGAGSGSEAAPGTETQPY